MCEVSFAKGVSVEQQKKRGGDTMREREREEEDQKQVKPTKAPPATATAAYTTIYVC